MDDTNTNDNPKLSREMVTPLITQFLEELPAHATATGVIYQRTLQQITDWIAERPGNSGVFEPAYFTTTALSIYLEELGAKGYSLSHRTRVKAIASRFARWMVEEKGLLSRNPVRQVSLPPQQQLAPRELSSDQRYVLRNLAERDGTARSAALFALGFWAGCRVSDVAHLALANAHIGPKIGWVDIGYKGGKMRQIDLLNEARRPLYQYLTQERKETASPYVFVSQRNERLTESGVHQWFRSLKARATKPEWELIQEITFHDLRHDFAHRARAAGWNLEEIAYYLGHTTQRGLPSYSDHCPLYSGRAGAGS